MNHSDVLFSGARALSYAIDFKPANILLGKNLEAVLTDFGSAAPLRISVESRMEAMRVQDEAAVNTTASYRSPELFNTPSHCELDGRCDVWSFGCSMYAMFFSRTPFETQLEVI